MLSSDIKYIFSNISNNKKNIYKTIPTLNTMRQYVNVTKRLGFNYEEGLGRGNQKVVTLKRIDGSIIGEIKDMKYPNNSRESMKLVKDKIAAEKLLRLSGIYTTNSTVYNENDLSKAKEEFYSFKSDRLAVIKPINMSGGLGVNVRINENDFDYFWNDTVNIIKGKSKREVNLMVQDYIEGFEARAVVIEGKLISIVARIPAYVVGNGKNSIKNLVQIKNRERQKCAHLRKRPIVLDEKKEKFLNYNNLNFNSIPNKGEFVLLSSLSNISNGGEMVDITDDVCGEIKSSAVKSIAAIPGLYSGGVDLIMKTFEDKEPRVIEINAWPMLQSTLYPTYGKQYAPQEYFLKSFYALDQFKNSPKQIYDIENHNDYVRNLMIFQQMKNEIHKQQILNNLEKL